MTESQIGDRLRAARGALTQKEAAKRARDIARSRGVELKLHTQTLSDYERGVIAKVPISVLESLAAVYGVSLHSLLGQSTGSDESTYLLSQVERLARRYQERAAQGAPPDELRRLLRELNVAVRAGVEVGTTDPGLLDLLVSSLVSLLAHGGLAPDLRTALDTRPAKKR